MAIYRLPDLSAGYAADWARMSVTNAPVIFAAARKVISFRRRYETVARACGMPWALAGVLHLREADCDFRCHPHNGDSLRARTVHVPAGRLPAPADPPFSWEESAIDAYKLDGLDRMGPWTVAAIAFAAERFNGFGPRNHGRRSGYLWAGSNVYDGGKYVADSVWSSSAWDQQPGVMPVLYAIQALLPGEAIIPNTDLPKGAMRPSDTLAAHPKARALAKAGASAAPAAPVGEAAATGSVSLVSIVIAVVIIAALAGLGVWLWRRHLRLVAAAASPVGERPQFETRATAEAAATTTEGASA